MTHSVFPFKSLLSEGMVWIDAPLEYTRINNSGQHEAKLYNDPHRETCDGNNPRWEDNKVNKLHPVSGDDQNILFRLNELNNH